MSPIIASGASGSASRYLVHSCSAGDRDRSRTLRAPRTLRVVTVSIHRRPMRSTEATTRTSSSCRRAFSARLQEDDVPEDVGRVHAGGFHLQSLGFRVAPWFAVHLAAAGADVAVESRHGQSIRLCDSLLRPAVVTSGQSRNRAFMSLLPVATGDAGPVTLPALLPAEVRFAERSPAAQPLVFRF